jgi:hypothetical protein
MPSDGTQRESEVLVVLGAATAPDSLAALRRQYQVTSVLPPRLVVLPGGVDINALGRLRGVEAILAQPSDEAPASLSEPERLFVSAWRARQHADAKTRAGEGLNWDAPGFLPPDPPTRK